MSAPEFADEPPQSDRLSAYDERHLVTYLRLLDAEKDEAFGLLGYLDHSGVRFSIVWFR